MTYRLAAFATNEWHEVFPMTLFNTFFFIQAFFEIPLRIVIIDLFMLNLSIFETLQKWEKLKILKGFLKYLKYELDNITLH